MRRCLLVCVALLLIFAAVCSAVNFHYFSCLYDTPFDIPGGDPVIAGSFVTAQSMCRRECQDAWANSPWSTDYIVTQCSSVSVSDLGPWPG